jgi:hypothetical protein
MAKPNYSFEKRQRELSKKKKKEEKLKEKELRKTTPGSGESGQGDEPAEGQTQSAGDQPAP